MPTYARPLPCSPGPDEVTALQYAPVQHQVKLRGRFLHDFAQQHLPSVMAPFGGQQVTTDVLGWGFAAASSRAFGLAGPTGQRSMLPFIDMANHSFVGNAEVIPGPDGAARLVSVSPLAEGDEVLISYGEHPNDELLLDYGFVVPNNPRDTCPIRFDPGLLEMAREMSGVHLMPTEAEWKVEALKAIGLADATNVASSQLLFGTPTDGGIDARLLAALRIRFARSQEPGPDEAAAVELATWRTARGVAELLLASFPTTADDDADALARRDLPLALAIAHDFRLTKKRLLQRCITAATAKINQLEH